MFKLEIDKELHLKLFKECLLCVDFVNTIENEEKFIKPSLERYADGKLLSCMISYKEKLVRNVEISLAIGWMLSFIEKELYI